MTNERYARVECELAGHKLILETGQIARQAHGSVLVTCGETQCFAAACVGPAREEVDFFPLTVDYREMTDAAGKIPGGFFKREGRPSEKEILTSRLIDRPIRPLFPDGFYNEVQVVAQVLSLNPEVDADIPAMIAVSAAMTLSGVPFSGPIGAVRVGVIGLGDAIYEARGGVLRARRAHCIEGAMLAACAFWVHGEPPLLLDMRAVRDFDHVVALYRRNGLWGAISKTNGIFLRSRDPVYRDLRELAMSYFHEYANRRNDKTLREYSLPYDLRRVDPRVWVTGDKGAWEVAAALDDVQALCRAAEGAVPDVECRRAIRSIELYTEILTSREPAQRGADFVRLRVLNALASFRSQLKAIESDRVATL